MDERFFALFGLVAPLTALISIAVSIALSPWFNWGKNALSDLGHSLSSAAAPVFNLGLLLTGFLAFTYAFTAFWKHARYTSICLTASAFLLQLVATFNEVYGSLHLVVSVLFFVSVGVTSLTYAVEKKSRFTATMFIIGLSSWILYWTKAYSAGVAVPETISSLAVVSWIIASALKTISANQR